MFMFFCLEALLILFVSFMVKQALNKREALLNHEEQEFLALKERLTSKASVSSYHKLFGFTVILRIDALLDTFSCKHGHN